MPEFPDLPIVVPDPPKATLREKYGGLYYLGIVGLGVLILLIATFAYGVWALRDVWGAVYVLHDPGRPEADRIRAAWTFTRNPSVNDEMRVNEALTKDLPRLARYVMAEGLTPEAIRWDPKDYASKVARSEGWPDWLRLLMARPMAYGVGAGYQIPWEPLDLLRQHKDPAIALWATYTRAVMAPGDPEARRDLERAAGRGDAFAPLAAILESAAGLEGDARVAKLDEATRWLRSHHPEAVEIWKGWTEEDRQLVEVPAPG